eukprot:4133658-Prymnesium_polylepis.1
MTGARIHRIANLLLWGPHARLEFCQAAYDVQPQCRLLTFVVAQRSLLGRPRVEGVRAHQACRAAQGEAKAVRIRRILDVDATLAQERRGPWARRAAKRAVLEDGREGLAPGALPETSKKLVARVQVKECKKPGAVSRWVEGARVARPKALDCKVEPISGVAIGMRSGRRCVPASLALKGADKKAALGGEPSALLAVHHGVVD